jgi:peptide/nickel transport system substrate-binding protein
VPNQRLTVKRFDGYWGEPPEWDEIQFLPIVEDSTAEIALETGELDYGRISPPAAERFKANDRYQVVALPSLAHHGLAMNVQHPKLKDLNVRQAIRYAIDVPSIIEAAYSGAAERACTILSPSSPAYWADAPCHERDVEKAKKFMAQAGLESLDLTLTIENSPIPRIAAEVIQANLADIGIKVEIESLDTAAFWEGGFGDAGIQNRQLTWILFDTVSPDPYWAIQWWVCDQVGQWNFSYWCDKKFDDLYYAALQERDSKKRLEMYHQMLQIWDDDAAIVWVAHPVQYFAGRADLVPAQSPMGAVVAQKFRTK